MSLFSGLKVRAGERSSSVTQKMNGNSELVTYLVSVSIFGNLSLCQIDHHAIGMVCYLKFYL